VFNSESLVEKVCFVENSVGKRFIGAQLTTICSSSHLVGLGLPSCLSETQWGIVVSPSSNSRPELWALTIMETLGWDICPDPRSCWSIFTGAGNQLFSTAPTSKAGLVKAGHKGPPPKSCRPGGKPLVYSNCKSSNGTAIDYNYVESFHNTIWFGICLTLELATQCKFKIWCSYSFANCKGKKYILVVWHNIDITIMQPPLPLQPPLLQEPMCQCH